jgi:hypothetical protein
MRFGMDSTERMRITSGGNVVLGATSVQTIIGASPILQAQGTTAANSQFSLIRNAASSGAPILSFGKSRGTVVGSVTAVQNNDDIGRLLFAGADGTNLETVAAEIRVSVDGTPSAGDVPSRITFFTSPSAGTSTERARINSAGNVGIGTSSPAQVLHVSGNARVDGVVMTNGGSAAAPSHSFSSDLNTGLFGTGGDVIGFSTNGSERARITPSGNFLIGKTAEDATTQGIRINAAGRIDASRESGSGLINMSFSNGGNTVGSITTTTTATTYVTSSDYRLKENIVDAPSASDSIDAIQIRSFDWKANGSHQKYGVIAQELEAIAPEAVSKGEKEDDMWGVDYSKLVPMLVKEVQSLRARVAQLEGN